MEEKVFEKNPGRPCLVVLRGPSLGDFFVLDRNGLILGSDPFKADAVIRDIEVEPEHAEIRREPDSRYAIRDLGTGKGTSVNGETIEDGMQPLRHGDRIFVGDSALEFVSQDPLREHFHDEIQRLINEDYLTGLMVKNRFDEEFEHALETARAQGLPLSVLMADIDNLKKINDAHGHLLGEFIVGEIGRIIRDSHIQRERCATRFGGDEYQILLPGTTKQEALEAAEEIRREVEEYAFEHNGTAANPTISLGVATHPEDGQTTGELTHAADEALYRAKRAGGNAVSD